MAKPTAPLLSFDARGQIAKTQVYASWRGRSYVRRYTIPANPKTSGQVSTRSVFTWLQEAWKLLDSTCQAPWIAAAKGKPVTDRNLWTKFNLPSLRPATSLATMQFSPGVGGMFPPTAVAQATPIVAGSTTISFTAPDLPDGWTLTGVRVCALPEQDPHMDTDYVSYTAESATSPITLAGLPGTEYYGGVWAFGTKPDGTVVYSPGTTIHLTD